MPKSYYPNGFANGVSIGGLTISQPTTGNVFYVDSGVGADAGPGTEREPFATIDYAVGRCTANNGDIIFVKAGHTETIGSAAAIDFDVAGVTVIGLGENNNRPALNFTATAGTVEVADADVTLQNLNFVCGIDAVVIALDINAARATVEGCLFQAAASKDFLTAIDINGGASGACSFAKIAGNIFWLPTTGGSGADRAIELGEVADGVQIIDNDFWVDADDAAIHNPTGKVLTGLQIHRNKIVNVATGQHGIELVSACTGAATGNFIGCDTFAANFDTGALYCGENYFHDGTADSQAKLCHAAIA